MNYFRGKLSSLISGKALIMVLGFSVSTVSLAAKEPEVKDVYLGTDFNLTAISVGSESLSTVNMRLKVGLDLFPDLIPVLSLESHFGFDITEDSATINGTEATLHLNNFLGLYVKASHEIEDIVKFYGLLGFAAAQMEGDTFVLEDETATGLSFAIGAGFGLPLDLEGTVEFMQLVNSDSYDVMMFSLGVNYRM